MSHPGAGALPPEDGLGLVPLVAIGPDGYAASSPPALVTASSLASARSPRWAVSAAADTLGAAIRLRVPVRRTWDVAEVHRLLAGGWRGDLPSAWAHVRGIPEQPLRRDVGAADDLFSAALSTSTAWDAPGPDQGDDISAPADLRPLLAASGHLREDLLEVARHGSDPRHVAALLTLVGHLAGAQRDLVARGGPRAMATAYSESAAAVLALELAEEGLPVDREVAAGLIAEHAGIRPRDDRHAAAIRHERDERVLRHAPGRRADLRQPADVKALLAAIGVDVPTTRAWVLEPYRQTHPLVDALLRWRKDERIATTYGYRWLDEHVGQDGRLRGAWTASDGAAGRMTAQNGLHNLPVGLRRAVVAEPGFVFVRADLGQIEPRILAAVSGDRAFAAATRADDLYAPVAATLGVERGVAKIAVLAAMYGQRSGSAGEALRGLERAFPTAMGLLDHAYAVGVEGGGLRTFGGRLVRLGALPVASPEDATRADHDRAAARGRFARNAVIQGSAAEFFKMWALVVRHAIEPLGARIVLCLHDELLIHTPEDSAAGVAEAVHHALTTAAAAYLGSDVVRFVADVSIVRSWADAKG